MLVLALSDAYIPDRAIDLPLKFQKLLSVPNKISQVVLLGNCTKSYEFLRFVNDISSNVVIVRGEYDNGLLPGSKHRRSRESIPINTVVRQGEFKIGCCNGYTVVPKSDPLSLLALARQLDADILLWGGTHNVEAFTLEGKFFINPGSCTGAFNTDWPFSFEDEDKNMEPEDKKKQSTRSNGESARPSGENARPSAESARPSSEGAGASSEGAGASNEGAGASNEGAGPNSEGAGPSSEDAGPSSEKDGDAKSPKEQDQLEEDDLELSELEVDGSNTPSFCLLDIQGNVCTLYIYIYIDGEVKVDKVVYQKDD